MADRVNDIADYLLRTHDLELERSPSCEHIDAGVALKVREKWREEHAVRAGAKNRDDSIAIRMADHDSENLLHVMSERVKQTGKTAFGYSFWWLTMDGKALRIARETQDEFNLLKGPSPVMSVDFLVRYLSFGPNRDKIDSLSSSVSKIYAGVILEGLPQELMEKVREVREEHKSLPEYLVQRRIRDRLNMERARQGEIGRAGLSGASEAIRNLR